MHILIKHSTVVHNNRIQKLKPVIDQPLLFIRLAHMPIQISPSLQVNEAQKGVSITWTGRGLKNAPEPELEKAVGQTTSETMSNRNESS